jgi:hypothetical protein
MFSGASSFRGVDCRLTPPRDLHQIDARVPSGHTRSVRQFDGSQIPPLRKNRLALFLAGLPLTCGPKFGLTQFDV